MDRQVITISRQYAAYGRTIARGLSEKLGIPFYDRDFVNKTVEESGYSREDVEAEGESMSQGSKVLNDILNSAAPYRSSYDAIFEAERQVVLKLSKEPCIIVGRCSNHILKEAGIPSYDIYLYGDMDFRVERARELGEYGEESDIRKYVEKRDTRRKVYYKNYTGNDMGEAGLYSVCMDVSTFGPDKTMHILYGMLKDSFVK
ncbi:MAG: cytidylate kinase-like family protein [Lachnospiraceae bacterium]|nr:cytidylate kinase-like family protein [Lachnospiraceae bacterium]